MGLALIHDCDIDVLLHPTLRSPEPAIKDCLGRDGTGGTGLIRVRHDFVEGLDSRGAMTTGQGLQPFGLGPLVFVVFVALIVCHQSSLKWFWPP